MARSSKNLFNKVVDDSLERDKKIEEKYEDRGGVGERQKEKELEKEAEEFVKDYNLVSYYGKDAPKARSFNTRRKASGGKVTKMGMGGKCRGMGAATRGGAFTRNG